MKKRKIINPNPKTLGDLRRALAGYEDTLDLISPCKIFVCQEKNYPYKLEFKHIKKRTAKKHD